MRILFTTIPGSGHFNPMVPLARAMVSRGHEVTFASSPAWTPRVEAAGFQNIPCGPSWVESMADPVMQEILRKDFFAELSRMGMVEDVLRAARTVEADLVAFEGAEIGGLLAGAMLDVPTVMVSPAAGKMWREMTRDRIARAASEHGLDGGRVASDDFPLAYIDRTPPALEMPGFVPYPNLVNTRPEQYDGGGEVPAWLDDLTDKPIVYVTLGTVFNGNLPLFQLVISALAAEPYNVVVATGAGVPASAFGELPTNVRLGGYLPQSLVAARSAAVLCHGGYNTVISAMSAGVPMYAIPMGADQPYNAERVAAAGAGLHAAIHDGPPVAGPPPFTPPAPGEVRDAVRRLLEDPSFKAGAERVAAEIAAMPPVVTAVERIEVLVRERAAIGV
ncbi:MAG: glycosyltransferase [Candidatus Dormibacteria bacterium]